MFADLDLPRGPALISGAGSLARLGPCLAGRLPRGGAVLLVSDPGVKPLAERVEAVLAEAGLATGRFDGLASDPTAAQVEAAAAAARALGAAAVVGLGGGSALDVAKLAACVAPGRRRAADYALAANPFPAGSLPAVLIPTTAGTGSEATRTAIMTLDDGAKVWAWGEEMTAEIALLDPELTVGLPPHLTAATGIDALVHAVEAATNRNRHPLGQAPALEAIALVARHLPTAVAEPGNLEARGAVQLAAWLAGRAIDVSGTGIAHAIGHALGALGHVHHGRAVGLCLGVALADNAAAAWDAHRDVAIALGLTREQDWTPGRLSAAYDALVDRVGLDRRLVHPRLDPGSLLAETLKPENRPMLAANCRAYSEAELGGFCRRLLAA
ncbi:Alcohol dehydrogenase, class IV [Tistlia consotensis]|uniref:Alcohol dehydrogenase, class IV n=1 Tax=Tistlia consotensis USBA 355 TaxID=560819 RepID=A0A1Y6C408_9PROT|nr:iron-containing alcohol dehydrogenase [Tistlia consotensis]SMF44414.1 Alcohol dehydrogenase, class IV [Tistlia consotensis USBA 355]SNR43266.1 Alcohol dehydrogenase, class IV [Tistlia consotensis]